MPRRGLEALRARHDEAMRRIEEVESAGPTERERWALNASRAVSVLSDAIDFAGRRAGSLTPTSPSRRRLEAQIETLEEAREEITDALIREVARLGDELAHFNARLDRLISDAESRARSLDRFRASAREVIDYAGDALAIAGAILAFGAGS